MKGKCKKRKLRERILSLFLAMAMCVTSLPAQAAGNEQSTVIIPKGIEVGADYGASPVVKKEHIINSSGMSDENSEIKTLDATCNTEQGTFWHSSENPGSNAWVTVDLGESYLLDEMWIWNMNQNNLSSRGFKNVKIDYSLDGNTWETLTTDKTFPDGNPDYPFQFTQADNSSQMTATNLNDGEKSPVSFGEAVGRYVRVTAAPQPGDGSWGGTNYGLSELRFTGREVPSVPNKNFTVNAGTEKELTVPVNFNGAGLAGIIDDDGNELTENTDYTVTADAVVFTADYLKNLAAGTYTFTVNFSGEYQGADTFTIVVKEQEPGIYLNERTLRMEKGEETVLTAEAFPAGAAITWTSNNPAVADVNQTGKVTAKDSGTAVITAASGDYEAYCTVAVNGYMRLWFDEKAASWERECFPIGNGNLGGMIYGKTDKEQIQVNEITLWSKGNGYQGGNVKDAYKNLKPIQDAMFSRLDNNFSGIGVGGILGNQNGCGAYQTLGDIYMDFNGAARTTAPENYMRELDLDDGIVRLSYDNAGVHFTREYLASYPGNVMAYRLTADQEDALSFKLDYDQGGGRTAIIDKAEDDSIFYQGKVNAGGMAFAVQLKVVAPDADITCNSDGTISVANGEDVLILMSAGTNYDITESSNIHNISDFSTPDGDYLDNADPNGAVAAEEVSVRVDAAAAKGYAALVKAHMDDYQEIMGRVTLDLGDHEKASLPMDELMAAYKAERSAYAETLLFQFGRYLLLSSSRDSLPANLQGLWNDSNSPGWNSDYHFNVNLQMNYWPAFVTDMEETAMPLVNYMDSLRKPGNVTAREHFGVQNGWVVNTEANPFGKTAPGSDFSWGFTPGSGAWTCQNLWDYYLYTKDEAVLEKIYPILKEGAEFWLGYLVEDPRTNISVNGENTHELVTAPGGSSEHGPIGVGTTYDMSLAYMEMGYTAEAAKILGRDVELQTEIKNAQSRMKPFWIGTDGQLKEWREETSYSSMPGTDPMHRHLSHLLAMHPGNLIMKDSGEFTEYYDAAVKALELRDDGSSSVGWSMAQKGNIFARVGDGEMALHHMNLLLNHGLGNNLLDVYVHPGWGDIFQIEANMGYTAGVAEMLMQSHQGYIQPLPALPEAWADGSYTGLVARGNFATDAEWADGQLTSFNVRSRSGGECVVRYPNISEADLEGGEFTVVDADTVKFDTTKGSEYKFSNIPAVQKPLKEKNVVLNRPVTMTGATIFDRDDLRLTNINDGNHGSRMAIVGGGQQKADVQFDFELDGAKLINRVEVYERCDRSYGDAPRIDTITVQVPDGNGWKTAATVNAPFANEGNNTEHATIQFEPVAAEGTVRIITTDNEKKEPTIWEVEVYGTEMPADESVIQIPWPGEGKDASPNIQKAIAKAKTKETPVTLAFEKDKVYEIFPETAYHETGYYISNAATKGENAKGERWSAIFLKDMKDVTIEGNNAMLNIHGVMTPILVDRSENITLQNLHVDWARPTMSEFTIQEVGDTYAKIKVNESSLYEIEGNQVRWLSEKKPDGNYYWTLKGGLCVQYDPVRDIAWRSGFSWGNSITDEGNNVLRLEYSSRPGLTVGQTYQFRSGSRDQVGSFIHRSKDVHFENMGFHYMHGLGIVGEYTENLSFNNLDCTPRKETGRTCASSADFIQISGCKGLVSVKNSKFRGAHDDVFNIHGTHLRVVEQNPEKNEITVQFMEERSWGFQAFQEGDEIEFINSSDMLPYGKNKVKSFERLDDHKIRLTLENELPSNIRLNADVVENATWTPDVLIENNKAYAIPTRGVLCTTRGNVVIKNNLFYKTQMSGVLLEDDARGWYESGYIRDMTIEGNTFVNCGGPVIFSNPQTQVQDPNKTVHENIRVIGNTFEGNSQIRMISTKDIEVKGNIFKNGGNVSLTACNGFEIADDNQGLGSVLADNSINDRSLAALKIEGEQKTENLDRSGMSISAVSNERPGNEGSHVLDGNTGSIWHTDWDNIPEEMSITIDLGGAKTFNQLAYLPRQNGEQNGMIKAYEIYAKLEGSDEFVKIADGNWPVSKDEKYASFKTITATEVKLLVTEAVNDPSGRRMASAAEINFRLAESNSGELKIGQKWKLPLTITGKTGMPSELPKGSVTYETSNAKVLAVSEDGTVTGMNPGKARVTVTVTAYGKTLSAETSFTVLDERAVTEIAVTSVNGITLLEKAGQKLQLAAKVLPENADNREINWNVTKLNGEAADCVTIDEKGLLTATEQIAAETVKVTAEAADGSGVKGELEIQVFTNRAIGKHKNVVLNRPVTMTGATIYGRDDLKLTNINDGDIRTRMAIANGGQQEKEVQFDFELDGVKYIDRVELYEYLDRGWGTHGRIDKIEVQIPDGDSWRTVAEKETPDDGQGDGNRRLTLEFEPVAAETVRIQVTDNEKKEPTIYELEVYGTEQYVEAADKEALISKLEETADLTEDDFSGAEQTWKAYQTAREEALAVVNDPAATQEEVDNALAKLIETLPTQEAALYIVRIDGEEFTRAPYNEKVTVTADEPEADQVFAGWKVNDKIVSLDRAYTFYVSNHINLIPVYADAPLEQDPEALLTNVIITKRPDTKSDVKYVGQLVLPKGCTIVDAGLVWSSKDGVELITDGALNPVAKATYISKISNTWQFSVTIKGMPAGRSMHGAIFATVKDADGNTQFIYSNAKRAEAK